MNQLNHPNRTGLPTLPRQATLNLSHVAIREADLDLSATLGVKYWFLPPEDDEKTDTGVVWLAPGASGTALHKHNEEQEYFTVEYGELDVFRNGHWTRLTAGQTLTVPAGMAHTVQNTSTYPCLYYYCISSHSIN